MAAFSWEQEVWRVDADEFGDLDPLEPCADSLTDADVQDHETELDTTDGGVSDGRGIVRVWVEDGRLSKVRVSPQWHAKLGRRSLADCFTQALAFAHIGVAVVPVREDVGHDDMDFGHLPPCDARALAAFQSVFAEVEERWGEALVRHEEHTPGPAPVTLGKHKGVTVSLNPHGMATRVVFDKAWVDNAQAGTIGTHVMRAAEKAYAQFIPADDGRAELDDIAAEHGVVLAAFRAMLNPKERS